MMKDNFDFFLEQHDSLLKEYPNKYIAISDCKVVASADTFEDAIYSAIDKGYEIGNFVVQLCSEGDSAYTQTFLTRVVFA